MLEGFKNFILRGNIVDLAVAVIIGAAFGAVVDSLVKDVITPLIGLIGGQPDFSSIAIGAKEVTNAKTGAITLEGGIRIGSFLNAIIGFLIKAAAVYFLVVVPVSRLMALINKPAPPAAPVTPDDVKLLAEIRDLLAKQAK
jgi:large conductance mechanosensitive channel